MAIAANLQEAANLSELNVQAKFSSASNLSTIIQTFLQGTYQVTPGGDPEEGVRTVGDWHAPFVQVFDSVPSAQAQQSLVDVANTVNVLNRMMSGAAQSEAAGRISGGQATSLLSIYNTNWG